MAVMVKKPGTGTFIITGIVVLVLLVLFFFMRPRPVMVDAATAEEAPFRITIEEEGRTRLPDRYVVSVPVTGHLNRVLLEPGDQVTQGESLLTVHPAPAEALDARTSAQARADLARAEAALQVATARVEAEEAAHALAGQERERMQVLARDGHVAREALDRAEAELRIRAAGLKSARFAVAVAEHEADNARAALSVVGGEMAGMPLEVSSPVDGSVLSLFRQSEGRVQAGEDILMVGNLDALEVEVDVLSADAVRLRPGMKVEMEQWGGDAMLPGRVLRIEPAGFTRISALGVEEQRVWVIVGFDAPHEEWQRLGDGYRVEARFILRESEGVLQVPASALFREEETWYTFVIRDQRVQRREIEPGERSGLMREVLAGLDSGEDVVLHPGQDISDGTRIRIR